MEHDHLTQLVRDSQAGEPQAKEQLVEAVERYIHFYCRTMLQNEDAALDASQDILLAMIKNLDALQNPDAFLGWLRQIILRTCKKRMSRMQRERQQLQQSLTDLLPEDEGPSQLTPDELLDREETRRIVIELVDALPPKQRLCVLMYYYDEMSVEEIASVLHLSAGTVKSRLHYARQSIKHGAEKYKGFPFYGLSPLPFLRYFLQQEAACRLSAAAAAWLTRAVLSGGAAAGTGAVGMLLKSILTVLSGKKAAVLVALVLTGTITGVLYQTAQYDAQPEASAPLAGPSIPERRSDPASEAAVRPAPQASKVTFPVQPEETPEPVGLSEASEPWQPDPDPAPSEPVLPVWEPEVIFPVDWLPPVLPTDSEPTDSEPVDSEPVDSFFADPTPKDPLPVDPIPVYPFQKKPPRVEPPPVDPVPEDPASVEPPPADPAPEVPVPVEPPPADPVPEVPLPVEPAPADPAPEVPLPADPAPEAPTVSRTFVDEYGNGGYGYTYLFAEAWPGELPAWPLTYQSSDPTVVSVNERGEFSTLRPGSAVLTAAAEDGSRYELSFTVENCFRWQFNLPDQRIPAGETTACTFGGYSTDMLLGYQSEITETEWSTNDPSVAEIKDSYLLGCDITAHSPGTAVITVKVTFRVDTTEGTKEMEDTCSFEVTVTEAPEPEDPAPPAPEIPDRPEETEPPEESDEETEEGAYRKELTEFGVSSGYGFTSSFALMWGGDAPWIMTEYSSSDPSVVDIDANGRFSTLSAGTAVLRAVDPNDKEHPYLMTVHVENHLDMDRTIQDTTAWAGIRQLHGFENKTLPYGKTFISVTWESSDPSVVTAADSGVWSDCWLTGAAPGEAVITGRYIFAVETTKGTIQMTDAVSFQVTVIEPEASNSIGESADCPRPAAAQNLCV